MQTYSSTSLKTFSANCPQAMGFQLDNKPHDRDIFEGGICAHAIAEQYGRYVMGATEPPMGDMLKALCDRTMETLITEGRTFNGNQEPPINPDNAIEGRDVAYRYFTLNPFQPEYALYEVGMGIDSAGYACEYDDPGCRYRGVIDCVYTEIVGDDDYCTEALVIRDYKTSWQADENELETLQRKGQAVLVWLHNPGATMIIQEVINMRTGQPFRKEIPLTEDNVAMLDGWMHDLLALCNAADNTRAARPGAGCVGCLWALSCPDCLEYAKDGPRDNAVELATLEARRSALIAILKPQIGVAGNVKIPGGYVGYRPSIRTIVPASAARTIVDHWYMDDPDPHDAEAGLLAALEPSSTNIAKLVKALYPDKNDAARDDFLAAVTVEKTTTRFGVHKK